MYNLKRNAELYLVEIENGSVIAKHKLDIYPDYSLAQTFNESGYARKTLHRPTHLHEGATITEANPANFNFTSPIADQASYPISLELATSIVGNTVAYFDLYFVFETITYKVSKCVFESLTFNMSRDSVLTASLSGSASSILPFTGTIPGTLVSPTQDYTRIYGVSATLNAQEFGNIAGISIDFSNSIEWQKASTVHTDGTIVYPSTYVITGRQASGSITQFLTSDNEDQFYDTTTTGNLILSIYSESGQIIPLLQFNFPSVVFTRRLNTTDLITRVYDFRLNSNTTIVRPLYKGV